MSTPLRRAVERRSAAPLVFLRSQPAWVPFLAMLAFVVGGLFAPPVVGAALLAVVAAFLGWVTYLAWPVLPPAGRLTRLAVLAVVAVAAIARTTS